MEKEIIPSNEHGKELDLFEEVILESEEEAKMRYDQARYELLHPCTWKSIAGKITADFTPDGQKDKSLRAGDFISIDIPGPGLSAGDGHDWVEVENIIENADHEADESVSLTLKVSSNPDHPEKGVAHFFADGATSTFIIARRNLTVKASYHGRNETPNLETPAIVDKIRNAVVATGAMSGASLLQWKSFLKGLIGEKQD
jgi:hypothetical protein